LDSQNHQESGHHSIDNDNQNKINRLNSNLSFNQKENIETSDYLNTSKNVKKNSTTINAYVADNIEKTVLEMMNRNEMNEMLMNDANEKIDKYEKDKRIRKI